MPYEDTKILEFNHYQKSDKASFIIYSYPQCLVEKRDGCKNDPENSSTTKIRDHIPSCFSVPAVSSIGSVENKHDVCKGKDCLKMFSKYLREHKKKKKRS